MRFSVAIFRPPRIVLHEVEDTLADLAMPDHPSATTDDRVVSLDTRRRYRPAAGRAPAPAGGLDQDLDRGLDKGLDQDLDHYARSGEPDDFRHRMAVNAVAFLFVAALVVAGVWLADTLTTMRKNQDCVLSGKRGCSPVETPASAR